ncbi:GNAT family N-acetyltransferase, partial [Lactobacillus crispatus]
RKELLFLMFKEINLRNHSSLHKLFYSLDQGKGYAKHLINFIAKKYQNKYQILQVGTGDSPLTIPFYEKCGFKRSGKIKDFFVKNYDHPIFEAGHQLLDMIYLSKRLN